MSEQVDLTVTLDGETVNLTVDANARGLTGATGSDANVTNANVNAAIEDDASATRTSLGLGTAATTDASAYATAAQGTDERVPTAAGLTTKFATNKATLVDADKLAILDSAAADAPKHGLVSALISLIIGTGRILAGAWAFSSTTRPTSAGTGSPQSDSLITRADGDARFGVNYTSRATSDQTVTNNTTLQNATNGIAVTIPAGTYEIYGILATENDAAAGAKLQFSFSSSMSLSFIREMLCESSGAPDVRFADYYTTTIGLRQTAASTSWAYEVQGRFTVAAEATITPQFCNFSAAGNTILKAGSHIYLTKIA